MRPKTEEVVYFQQSKSADAYRRLIGQGIGVCDMSFQGDLKSGQRLFVQAENQLLGCWRRKDLVKENLQIDIRDHFQAKRRFAHFANPLAQGRPVFGAEVGVQAESHFQFVNRFGRDARDEDLVEPFEGIVITLEPANTFLDGQTGCDRLIHGANSGESRQISIGLVGVHINHPGPI